MRLYEAEVEKAGLEVDTFHFAYQMSKISDAAALLIVELSTDNATQAMKWTKPPVQSILTRICRESCGCMDSEA